MSDKLDQEKLQEFFQNFLEKYEEEVQRDHPELKDRLKLFKSMPAKCDFLLDKDMRYCAVLLSKHSSTQFSFDNSFVDIFMVIAMANSKKYEYGEKGDFLYLFQLNAARFDSWKVDSFVKDFIKYELATTRE